MSLHPRVWIITAVGMLSVTSIMVYFAHSSSTKASAATSDAIQTVVSEYENANLAVYSPVATSPSSSTACSAVGCTVTSTPTANPAVAREQFTDVKPPLPNTTDWTSSTVVSTLLNTQVVLSRNRAAFLDLAAPGIDSLALSAAARFNSDEQSLLSGSFSQCGSSSNCTITNSAGASVVSFSNEVVNGSVATISAVVRGWQEMANVSSTGVIGGYHVVQNELFVNYVLSSSTNGNWIITSRVGDFVPGQGP